MSDLLEWAKLVLGTLFQFASLGFTILLNITMYRAFRMWMRSMNPVTNRNAPTGRFFLRRVWCRHRATYARIKDQYGRTYTACARCGADVNEDRSFEERV